MRNFVKTYIDSHLDNFGFEIFFDACKALNLPIRENDRHESLESQRGSITLHVGRDNKNIWVFRGWVVGNVWTKQ